MPQTDLHLFDAFGVELEYMLVDAHSFDVRPMADQLLKSLAGELTSDVTFGPITWSNELALHVLELKVDQPVASLARLPSHFELAIADLQSHLDKLGLRLLPTAVHPWMQPSTETHLWPHQCAEIYAAYHRIFNCHTHGWANVQSVHLNLPFSGEAEFARLHAAVRLVLPLLPALAASSPILEGKYSGMLDTRMKLYADHCRQVPSLTGQVIPEPIFNPSAYQREILDRLAGDMAPHDQERVLQAEFLNARGAIARFDRGSIEIRVMDVQEYPEADVAICAAVVAVLRALCNQHWSSLESQQALPTELLRQILEATAQQAESAVVEHPEFLAQFGIQASNISAGEIWTRLLSDLRRTDATLDSLFEPLETILTAGSLAQRIRKRLGMQFTRSQLFAVYTELAECLKGWHSFQP